MSKVYMGTESFHCGPCGVADDEMNGWGGGTECQRIWTSWKMYCRGEASIGLWWRYRDWKARAPEDGETTQVTVAGHDDIAKPPWGISVDGPGTS